MNRRPLHSLRNHGGKPGLPTGLSLTKAKRKLRAAGLEVGEVDRRPSGKRKDSVLKQGVGEGTELQPGSSVADAASLLGHTVDVYISTYLRPSEVGARSAASGLGAALASGPELFLKRYVAASGKGGVEWGCGGHGNCHRCPLGQVGRRPKQLRASGPRRPRRQEGFRGMRMV